MLSAGLCSRWTLLIIGGGTDGAGTGDSLYDFWHLWHYGFSHLAVVGFGISRKQGAGVLGERFFFGDLLNQGEHTES